LSFWELSLWLAFTAIILLITTEMLSPYYRKIHISIDKKRLKNVAFLISILFLVTVAMRIISILLTQ